MDHPQHTPDAAGDAPAGLPPESGLHAGSVAPAEAAAPRGLRRLRASSVAPRLAVESALIVLSVLLGLALNEWGDQRRERARAAETVANFRREITQNIATLERAAPLHRAMAARLDSAARQSRPGETAFDGFAALMPQNGLQLVPLADAAWETAVSTGSLRLLRYDQASALSETYLIQRTSLGSTIDRISDRFLSPQNFDPAARVPMLRTHQMLMVELSGQESYLLEIYRGVLRKLPER
jgi:hypothetical protein